jgi:hypothetical protein
MFPKRNQVSAIASITCDCGSCHHSRMLGWMRLDSRRP